MAKGKSQIAKVKKPALSRVEGSKGKETIRRKAEGGRHSRLYFCHLPFFLSVSLLRALRGEILFGLGW
jgi:hypothetical protein